MKLPSPKLLLYMGLAAHTVCSGQVIGMLLGVFHFGRRIFITERFKIPSESMKPTLVPGDKVWVNKLLYGARIYTSFDFEDHAPLKCFRMPGIRKIRPGDVIYVSTIHLAMINGQR